MPPCGVLRWLPAFLSFEARPRWSCGGAWCAGSGRPPLPVLEGGLETGTASVPAAGPIAAIDSIAAVYTCGSAPGSMRRSTNAKERDRAPVAEPHDIAGQRLLRLARARRQCREQQRRRFVAAVQRGDLDGLATDQRLGVGQERHQLLDLFGAAEFTQEGMPPGRYFPVRRIHQLLHGLAAARADRRSTSRSRRRERASCSLESTSARGATTAVPIAWQIRLKRS